MRVYCSLAVFVVSFGSLFVLTSSGQTRPVFPQIKPKHLIFKIEGGEDFAKEVVIRTRSNAPAYRLTVFAISLNRKDFESIKPELNGIGNRSTRFDTKYEENLLNPDRWGHGEIEFGPKDFEKKNIRYMVLRLRRMKITITVSDAILTEDFPGNITGIKSAKITVDVKPDPNCRSRPIEAAVRNLGEQVIQTDEQKRYKNWLTYEPAVVELRGKLTTKMYYGPPNYGENPKTDSKEVFFILLLSKPVNVRGNPDPAGPEDQVSVENVRRMELVLRIPHKNMLGKNVTVKGMLFHAFTGHHHTDVLMSVRSISLADGSVVNH